MTLTLVSTGADGRKTYFTPGIYPFVNITSEEAEMLKWGDTIRDNNGKGMHLYVNQCASCGNKIFGHTLILVPHFCNTCEGNGVKQQYLDSEKSPKDMIYDLADVFDWIKENHPGIYQNHNLGLARAEIIIDYYVKNEPDELDAWLVEHEDALKESVEAVVENNFANDSLK